MTACQAVVALLFVLATSGSPAWAQGPAAGSSQVRIVGADCAAAPAFSTFVETLRVELAGHGASCCALESDALPTSAAGVDLSIEPCDPNREMVVVSLDDRARGRSVRRPVSLADVAPEARPRALALAIAELLRSFEQAPAPEPERMGPPGGLSAPAGGGPRPGGSAGAAVGAELRYYPSPSTVLWGARLAPSFVRDRWFATLDLHAASGSRRFDIGTVDVRLFGAGLALGPRFTFGGAALDLGLAGEIGWAWIGGEPIDPGITSGAGSGLIGAVGVRIGLEAPAAHLVRAQALLQAGATVRSLTGEVNGVAAVGVSGAYVIVGLGIGLYGDR